MLKMPAGWALPWMSILPSRWTHDQKLAFLFAEAATTRQQSPKPAEPKMQPSTDAAGYLVYRGYSATITLEKGF